MQKSDPEIAEHRSVYKRIDLGAKPVQKAAPSTTPAPDRVDAHAKHVWRQVIKTSGGDVPDVPEPKQPEPVNIFEHLGSGGWCGYVPRGQSATVHDHSQDGG